MSVRRRVLRRLPVLEQLVDALLRLFDRGVLIAEKPPKSIERFLSLRLRRGGLFAASGGISRRFCRGHRGLVRSLEGVTRAIHVPASGIESLLGDSIQQTAFCLFCGLLFCRRCYFVTHWASFLGRRTAAEAEEAPPPLGSPLLRGSSPRRGTSQPTSEPVSVPE